MKKILIYTVTAGNGHNTIAKTIKNSLMKYYGDDIDIKFVDFFKDYKSKLRAFIVDNFYRWSVKHLRNLYNWLFRKKQKDKPVKRNSLDIKFVLHGKYKKVLKTIEEYKPDYIFCTHFYPCIALTTLKEKGEIDVPFSSMVTDFVVCPFIERDVGVEKMITPCEEMKETLLKIGYKEEQILNLGFPAKIEKNITFERDESKKLNILIMSGSGSFYGLNKNVRQLLKADLDISVTFLNGKNEKQKKNIDKLISKCNNKNTMIKNFGFVDDETQKTLLDDCDIIITKCGANSLVEALNLGKIVFSTDKLAEQEYQNVVYFRKYFPIYLITRENTILNILENNKFDNEFIKMYKEKVCDICPSDVGKKYADFIYTNCK